MESLDHVSLGKELERLSIAGINCLNTRDFEFSTPAGQELVGRLSSQFEAVLGNVSPLPMSWSAACDVLKAFFKANPDAQYEVRNTSSDIDNYTNTAIVYVELAMNLSTGITVHGMSTCMWKRDAEGKWCWYRFWNMRNISGNEGFV